MNVDDVLVGDNQIRAITATEEYTFTRDGDTVAFRGEDEPPMPVVEAVEENGFTVTNTRWPKRTTIRVYDESDRGVKDLFDRENPAFDVARGMGNHVDLTYDVERDGDYTLVGAQAPTGERLVQKIDGNPTSAFNTLWAEYTADEFGNACELYLPDTLEPANYEEYGYLPRAKRSRNERTKWSQFYDFYRWLAENGYAIVPLDE